MKSSSQKQKKPIDDIDNDNASISIISTTKPVEWSIENELILVEWCDYAQCYKWLHNRAYHRFSYMHAWFTIPTIVLSTLTGTASFAQASVAAPYNTFTPMIIGTINIFIGVLTTVQQYLKISELNESHRVASIAWDKFARNIRIELAKAPSERMDAAHFIKMNRQEFDRMMETSPDIPEHIVDEFQANFSGEENSVQRKNYEDLKKPDICDTIVSANANRHHWYLEQQRHTPKLDAANLDIKDREDAKEEAAEKYKKLQEKIKNLAVEKANQQKRAKLDIFFKSFQEIHGRAPLQEEMVEYFTGDTEVSTKDISSYIPIRGVDISLKNIEKSVKENSARFINSLENRMISSGDISSKDPIPPIEENPDAEENV